MAQRYDAGEVITAMVTPFNKDFSIDFTGLEKLVKHLINNGSDTLLVAATTGESPTLTLDEEMELLKFVKGVVGTKAKIIMSTGSNCTETAVEQSKRVAQAGGADAILSVVPYYNKPSQSGLINHFTQIAQSVDLPVLLYNIPGRTGINMLPETIATIAEKNPNVFGVKQSNGDLDQVSEIILNCPQDFTVLSGDDSLTLPMLSLGARGVVSVASHIIGKEIKQMIRLFKLGKVNEAAALHASFYPTFKKIFMAPNPVPIKAALNKLGFISDTVRNPLVTLTETEKEELFKVLHI
ncbi:MAG: 4-hydroxy-tetrahydrodipicolinate synthase [bacterium]|nr:4-hydroxy-tetrahydrodipicolinate synthase [bacterium]